MRLPVIMLILSYAVLLLTDWYIWNDFRIFSLYKKFKPESKGKSRWSKIFLIFAALVFIVLTVAVIIPHQDERQDLQIKMWLLFGFLTVVLAQIIYVIGSLLGFVSLTFGRRRLNTGLWVGLPLAVFLFSAMWYGALVGRYKIEVKDVVISSPKVPEGFNGYKIVQLSDLHLGTWGSDTSFVSRLVDKVNAQDPDLIVFTGDLVNRKSDEALPFIKVLSRLKAKDGVYSILGNHDYGDYIKWDSPDAKTKNLQDLFEYQAEMGWKMLDNQRSFITAGNPKDTLVIMGVGNWGEPPFSTYGDLNKAYPESKDSTYNLNDHRFKILLSHNPEHWNKVVSRQSNIDLTLSGHTHAMQILFQLGPLKWTPSQYKYDLWGGLYNRMKGDEKLNIYVNIGAGEVGLPMRIGATPEITSIILRRE